MLGVGWTEMMVVGVVALIVIGPKDLPMLMQRLGKVIGTVRRMGTEFQREINKTTGLDQVRDLRKSITEPLRQTTAEIAREFNAMSKDGSVAPTGALKPADPAVESVYETINKQAGIAPGVETKSPAASAALAAAVSSTVAADKAAASEVKPVAAKPSRPKRVAKAVPAPTTAVTSSDLPAVPEPVPSPAPVEAIAPAQKKPAKKSATPVRRAKKADKPDAVPPTPAVSPAIPAAKPRAKKS